MERRGKSSMMITAVILNMLREGKTVTFLRAGEPSVSVRIDKIEHSTQFNDGKEEERR